MGHVIESYEELLQFGREVAGDPTTVGLERQGRAMTNVEMHALTVFLWSQIQDRIDRDGCCGGTIDNFGMCPNTGRTCPMVKKAREIERDVFHGRG